MPPVFKTATKTLYISESATKGASYSLPAAVDLDCPMFSVQKYYLVEDSTQDVKKNDKSNKKSKKKINVKRSIGDKSHLNYSNFMDSTMLYTFFRSLLKNLNLNFDASKILKWKTSFVDKYLFENGNDKIKKIDVTKCHEELEKLLHKKFSDRNLNINKFSLSKNDENNKSPRNKTEMNWSRALSFYEHTSIQSRTSLNQKHTFSSFLILKRLEKIKNNFMYMKLKNKICGISKADEPFQRIKNSRSSDKKHVSNTEDNSKIERKIAQRQSKKIINSLLFLNFLFSVLFQHRNKTMKLENFPIQTINYSSLPNLKIYSHINPRENNKNNFKNLAKILNRFKRKAKNKMSPTKPRNKTKKNERKNIQKKLNRLEKLQNETKYFKLRVDLLNGLPKDVRIILNKKLDRESQAEHRLKVIDCYGLKSSIMN